jgi:cell wall-associated NlpC family hydrolase
VEPSGEVRPARYRVKIPATDTYSVYAWWPSAGVDNVSARYGVSTTSGVKWTEVDQRKDGGSWVKLGEYRMKSGDRYAVQVAPGLDRNGRLVADAVAVVRGVQSAPPEKSYESAGEETMFTAQGKRPSRKAIVRQARRHLGTRYVLSPPGPCRSFRKEDCSCHTRVVFQKFGKRLPDHPARQWKRGRRIPKSQVRPGDLVFFKENGRTITHVGIYSGNGNIIHASSYFGKVVESKMRYVKGYIGGRRLGW